MELYNLHNNEPCLFFVKTHERVEIEVHKISQDVKAKNKLE